MIEYRPLGPNSISRNIINASVRHDTHDMLL